MKRTQLTSQTFLLVFLRVRNESNVIAHPILIAMNLRGHFLEPALVFDRHRSHFVAVFYPHSCLGFFEHEGPKNDNRGLAFLVEQLGSAAYHRRFSDAGDADNYCALTVFCQLGPPN